MERGPRGMCTYCYATLGAVVGTAVVAKVGGLGAVKLALTAFVARFLLLKR